jgi:hypothetical protein
LLTALHGWPEALAFHIAATIRGARAGLKLRPALRIRGWRSGGLYTTAWAHRGCGMQRPGPWTAILITRGTGRSAGTTRTTGSTHDWLSGTNRAAIDRLAGDRARLSPCGHSGPRSSRSSRTWSGFRLRKTGSQIGTRRHNRTCGRLAGKIGALLLWPGRLRSLRSAGLRVRLRSSGRYRDARRCRRHSRPCGTRLWRGRRAGSCLTGCARFRWSGFIFCFGKHSRRQRLARSRKHLPRPVDGHVSSRDRWPAGRRTRLGSRSRRTGSDGNRRSSGRGRSHRGAR